MNILMSNDSHLSQRVWIYSEWVLNRWKRLLFVAVALRGRACLKLLVVLTVKTAEQESWLDTPYRELWSRKCPLPAVYKAVVTVSDKCFANAFMALLKVFVLVNLSFVRAVLVVSVGRSCSDLPTALYFSP